MKLCSKCNLEKVKFEFHKRKLSKDGFQAWCKDCLIPANKSYSLANKTSVAVTNAVWYSKNKEASRTKKRKNFKDRLLNDPLFRVACNLRRRMRQLLGQQRSKSAVRDLGCSLVELRKYLESNFKPGMTWDNYGEWHIDHIKPLSSFDLTDHIEEAAAVHYTNLQPLWALENKRKYNKEISCL